MPKIIFHMWETSWVINFKYKFKILKKRVFLSKMIKISLKLTSHRLK